ncbi:piggyBac transposable element-derived protein 3 [Hydra vulgaris]|uniref:piggyBac transposable element-derived protein 3 n=1 Tax=Hydra vulgaris TaxID=6087 RepID=UPI0032EA051A
MIPVKNKQKVKTHLVSKGALVINFDKSDVDSDSNNSDLDGANYEKDLFMYSDFTCSESESIVDESSDDESFTNKITSANKFFNHVHRWRKVSVPKEIDAFNGEPFPEPPYPELTPYQYFKKLFSSEIFDLIVEQTNLYSANLTGTSIAVTNNDIEKYVDILVLMSIIKLPHQRLYWSNETRIPNIADVMTSKQFEKIKRYLHFSDNSKSLPSNHPNYDKLFKVRPLIQLILKNIKNIPQEESHSIDEQILPTKGRSFLRQYLPKKPHKWGIKVWARCGVFGIVYDFETYCRKYLLNKDELPGLLMGGNVVYRLTQSLPSGVNYKIFFDNYFSSIDIFRLLKEKIFLAVATIRKDRLKDASKKLLNEKDLKKAGRGSSDYIVDVNSGICIVRWYDNNIVQLISNYVGNEPGTPANRWSEKDKKFVTIDRPKIVEIYNAHMGGVDLCDMLLETYTGKTLLLAKRGRPSLAAENKVAAKRRPPNIENPSRDIRFDMCSHFPVFQEKQSRCRQCKNGFASIQCMKCKISLCLLKGRNCFNEFHGVDQ